MFRELDRPAGTSEWSLVHGFFADMGGILLESPDYPPFPVKAEELHYLIKHRHVDFPTISKDDIKASNKTDGVSKFVFPHFSANSLLLFSTNTTTCILG